jgi:carbamoyltransferase
VKDLVLSGGCALNSAFNGQLLERSDFERLHVFCAPADDGNAVGAALLAWWEDHPDATWSPRSQSPYLGSRISPEDLEALEESRALRVTRMKPEDTVPAAVNRLASGQVIGWVQGRAEFGPRALGNRSILADPRRAELRDRINTTIKHREGFRPFAPSILHEHGPEWFEDYQASPYMERTLRFREEVRAEVPAVVHVDGTGRLQSVTHDGNPRFHALLSSFHERTHVPLLLNTSLNVMGKPIVHSVEDAVALLCTSSLDALFLENFLLAKGE